MMVSVSTFQAGHWRLCWSTRRSIVRRELSATKRRTNNIHPKQDAKTNKTPRYNVAIASAFVLIGISAWTRHYREKKLQECFLNIFDGREDPQELIRNMQRTGLMGSQRSVKEELNQIQDWHVEHGYRGGITLRDLTQHLFVNKQIGIVENLEDLVEDPMRLARRECYYLYYEIKGDGEIQQQIFCRGTTLAVDILTCLSVWMVYDDELDCRIHSGFKHHADRILNDILPLLVSPDIERATVEVSGHSLGGSVAFILAAKLRKRGYNVIRVTTVGAPRICATKTGALNVQNLLPKDTIRIENDTDIVPFLPPFGESVGNKLYLLNSSQDMVYFPTNRLPIWADSVFINMRLPEIVAAIGQPHRIPTYVSIFNQACEKASKQYNLSRVDMDGSCADHDF